MANYEASLSQVFYALTDSTRRAVLLQLVQRPASITELAQPFDMALPSFMKHITVLEDSGLIRTRKIGRVRTCQLIPRQLAAAEDWLNKQRTLWEARTDRMATYIEQLVEEEQGNGNK